MEKTSQYMSMGTDKWERINTGAKRAAGSDRHRDKEQDWVMMWKEKQYMCSVQKTPLPLSLCSLGHDTIPTRTDR